MRWTSGLGLHGPSVLDASTDSQDDGRTAERFAVPQTPMSWWSGTSASRHTCPGPMGPPCGSLERLTRTRHRRPEALAHCGLPNQRPGHQLVVTNLRHFEALTAAHAALQAVRQGLANNMPGDLVAVDAAKPCTTSAKSQVRSTPTTSSATSSHFCIGK